MKKIILTKGLPGSGKTTWAKELMSHNQGQYKRVNKDELRAMIDNGQWSKANEKMIIDVRDTLIHTFMNAGYNIIVDDTNFHQRHEDTVKGMISIHNTAREISSVGEEYQLEVKDFTDTDINTCIERDLKRQNSVGEKVIRKMYSQFLRPKPIEVKYNENLPDAIICDLDGTLALFGDANPYDRDFLKDIPNDPVRDLVDNLKQNVLRIKDSLIICSGRQEKFREQTEEWLKKHWVNYDALFMRKTDDIRKDLVIKKEIYEEQIKSKFNVLFVLDDRDQVVEMWRSEGLTCLQVNYGDF